MKFVDILYEKADNIAWVTINRPEVYNATRGRTTDEMSIALEDAELDDSIRVVVISGTGPNAFCAGRDQSEDRLTDDYHGTATLDYTTLIKEMPKPAFDAEAFWTPPTKTHAALLSLLLKYRL